MLDFREVTQELGEPRVHIEKLAPSLVEAACVDPPIKNDSLPEPTIRLATPPVITSPIPRTGRWTPDEKILFLYGLKRFGKGRWKKMSIYLPHRSLVQIKSHAQKVLKRLEAGENVFRRLEENYKVIDSLIVKAAKERDAITNLPVAKSASTVAKRKRVSKKLTVAPQVTPEHFGDNLAPANPPTDGDGATGAIDAAAALCQLSSLGGTWDPNQQTFPQRSC